MVPDPNPTSERLLREYAKKRRDQAGTSPEIHPATRKMLQGEVVRIYGAATAESKKASATFVLWQRIICSTAAIALVVLVVSVMFPVFKSAKNKPVEIAAIDRIRPEPQLQSATVPSRPAKKVVGGAATIDDLAVVAQKEKSPEDRLSRVAIERDQPSGSLVGASSAPTDALADKFKQETPKSVASSAPTAVTSVKQFSESGQVASGKLQTKSERTSQAVAPATPPSEQLPRAPIAQSDESVPALAAAPAPDTTRNFKQLDVRANYRQNLQSPAVPNVLSNFQVISTGTTLRIIDADGSIYEGVILTASKDISKTDAAEVSATQNVAFRVSGENRTLHQNLVFEGTNLVLPQTPAAGALAKTSQAEFKKAAQVQLSVTKEKSLKPVSVGGALQNVIQGSVNIGATNLYKIQAVESP